MFKKSKTYLRRDTKKCHDPATFTVPILQQIMDSGHNGPLPVRPGGGHLPREAATAGAFVTTLKPAPAGGTSERALQFDVVPRLGSHRGEMFKYLLNLRQSERRQCQGHGAFGGALRKLGVSVAGLYWRLPWV